MRETTERSFRFVCTYTKKLCLPQKSPYFCLGLYARDWSNEIESEVIETLLRRTTRFARNYHAGSSRHANQFLRKKPTVLQSRNFNGYRVIYHYYYKPILSKEKW